MLADYFAEAVAARDITELNIAAGQALQALPARRSITRILWFVVVALLVSDLLPLGPLELGLLPDLHIWQWLLGHPYGHNAGVALYHVTPEEPHFLGVTLPWGKLF